MSGNSFGNLFRITTFGESHGPALGVVIDGCPAGLELDLEFVQSELARRRPGQSDLVTPRKEDDLVEILSGLFEGKTTGMPIMAVVKNSDAKSKDYAAIKDLFRPGHADFTYFAKHQHRDYRGGGRSSARETIGRVIGGAIAKQILSTVGISIRGAVTEIGGIAAKQFDWEQVESNPARFVDATLVAKVTEAIEDARRDRDSLGGIVEVQALGVPPGLGEPVFDRLDAVIAQAMMSLPAVKGVEIGAGFAAARMRGSEMNDLFYPEGFRTNNHGGVLGGISSGAPVVVKLAIKPTSSLPKAQTTVDNELRAQEIVTKGRHDPCVALRAVPIAESMLALVILDFWMIQLSAEGARAGFSPLPKVKYGLANS